MSFGFWTLYGICVHLLIHIVCIYILHHRLKLPCKDNWWHCISSPRCTFPSTILKSQYLTASVLQVEWRSESLQGEFAIYWMGTTKSVLQKLNRHSSKGLTFKRKSEYEVILIAFSSRGFSFLLASRNTVNQWVVYAFCLERWIDWQTHFYFPSIYQRLTEGEKSFKHTWKFMIVLEHKEKLLGQTGNTEDGSDQDGSLERWCHLSYGVYPHSQEMDI